MKRVVQFLLVVTALLFAPLLFAQGISVGVVNANKIMEKSPQYEAVRKALESESTRRNEELSIKSKQLKKLEEKLVRDRGVMTEEEVSRLEQDIRSHRRKLKYALEESREDLSLRRTEEINKLLRKISEVVHQVGEEENIDLILSEGGVVYASSKVDLSKQVLERLEMLYKESQERK
ncbi:MAG: OmpH family outer membrane protein [Gammaproteobacteria bacterium]|nr:OmpH family outer membrane protein [Gammaproteobacteria bacterium]